ncbi:hypothetical protein BDV95DRAFT_599381 [Massariosphaeria phaeospora]|uniref:Chitin-binding type-4 domain-containing protein n=1 Tax=Massariosphaeria phaeospora TaxID=100035 RepID=A0A7C8I213_9PLEO|nr:hypothetical protein BDV95DRAFT_599381 [Massariosphaeria phaeospora]
MKNVIAAATALFAASASAHSWLACTDYDNTEMLKWMEGNSTLPFPITIDPTMPAYANFCKGWPRAKQNPGNWIEESSNYVWNLVANKFNGETAACHPSQRSPNQLGGAPRAQAKAGSTIRLMFGGNGHARGASVGGDPGYVTVYTKGEPESDITDLSEFTDENKLQSNGFSAESFAYPADPNVKSPTQGLQDKGNWQSLQLPKAMIPGRHMFVWVWSYEGKDQWSTCFDVDVSE